jgi:wyosine [tRNA(Phe)-imidazoG37] synthetase (radical SAM superfamily)
MNRLMTCTTCNGEGRIQDRRDTNRDEEEVEEIEEELEYIKKDWKSYSYPETSRYACKIDYNEEAKEVIAYLRKLGKSSGFTIRVRGSGPRAPQHRKDGKDLRRIYDQSLPLKFSEQVRIYIDHK